MKAMGTDISIVRDKGYSEYDLERVGYIQTPYKYVKSLVRHGDDVYSFLQLSRNTLATSSNDCTIKIWNIYRKSCIKTLRGHSNCVVRMIKLRNGHLASACSSHEIKIWNLSTFACLSTISTGHSQQILRLIQLKGGQQVVSSSCDSDVKIWDLSTGECVAEITDHTDWVRDMVQLRNGNLATASDDKTIRIWDIKDLSNISQVKMLNNSHGYITSLVLLRDGRLMGASTEGYLEFWDIETELQVADLQAHDYDEIRAIQLRSGNVVTFGADGTFKVWELSKNTCLYTQHHFGTVGTILELSNGDLATLEGKQVSIWAKTRKFNIFCCF